MAYSAQKNKKNNRRRKSNVARNNRYCSHSRIAKLDDNSRLNPMEININSNKVIKILSNFKKYKFRFIIESLLFSVNLQNNTDMIFITCGGLTEAKTAPINTKLHKMLGVVYKVKESQIIRQIHVLF